MYSKENIPPAFYIQGVEGSQDMTTATDPATNAATTAAIVNSFAGVIITTTTTGNSQTLASPTATTAAGQIFTVVNNDTSTDNVPVVANSVTFTVSPGESQSFIWDGTAWGPTDLGITAIPVVVAQGGTGLSTLTSNAIYKGNGTSPPTASGLTDDGTTITSAENVTLAANKNLTLGDSGNQVWDVSPAANGGFSGDQESVTAGATVALRDVLYEGADGEWYLADADASATMPAMRMAVGSGVDGGAVNTITRGVVRNDSWTWTIGMPIYVSTTGTTTNTLTQTAPSGEFDVIQIVGYALSATVMYFDPSPILTEVGLDYVDVGTATPTTITMAELSAIPKVFMADHSSDQTFNLAAPSASDIGKQFWIVKDGTGAGKVILDMPADVYVDDSASGGTIYCAVSARASALFIITSATTVQTLCATSLWTTT